MPFFDAQKNSIGAEACPWRNWIAEGTKGSGKDTIRTVAIRSEIWQAQQAHIERRLAKVEADLKSLPGWWRG